MNLLAERGALDFHTHLGLWEVRGLAPDLYPGDDGLATIIDQMLAAGCRSASINLTSDIPVMKMGENARLVRSRRIATDARIFVTSLAQSGEPRALPLSR